MRTQSYPPRLFRSRSGVTVAESIEEGVAREGLEDVGLSIALRRYSMRACVAFETGPGETTPGDTYVLLAGRHSCPDGCAGDRGGAMGPREELMRTLQYALGRSQDCGLWLGRWVLRLAFRAPRQLVPAYSDG